MFCKSGPCFVNWEPWKCAHGALLTDVVEADARTVVHDLVHDDVHHLTVDVVETVM